MTPVCGVQGPPPGPGLISYWCSLDLGHDGAHQAIVDGELVDSWPQ